MPAEHGASPLRPSRRKMPASIADNELPVSKAGRNLKPVARRKQMLSAAVLQGPQYLPMSLWSHVLNNASIVLHPNTRQIYFGKPFRPRYCATSQELAAMLRPSFCGFQPVLQQLPFSPFEARGHDADARKSIELRILHKQAS